MNSISSAPHTRQPKEMIKKPVPLGEVKTGMYVCELDRPWIETPFLMQGFQIFCNEEIEQLAHYCTFVYIDELRSVNHVDSQAGPIKPIQDFFPNVKLKAYDYTTTWKNEIPDAQKAISSLATTTTEMMDSVRNDTPFDMAQVKTSVSPMIESVLRNPDASMWLARLKDKDDYIYRHSIGCSIWAVALGRQIGLPRHDIRSLAIGTLLFDIGKTKLPKSLLTKKTDLTLEERELVKKHVDDGIEAVSKMHGVSPDVLDIIKYHHERLDGSGYPYKLSGKNIPIMARIAAIVDCYDAMTSERHWVQASSPSIVIRKLYAWRGKLFQSELVEEFIQAVGLYPSGTIVKLSTGEIGIVTEESQRQRLHPKLLMLLNKSSKPFPRGLYLDLATTRENATGKKLNIVKSLEPGSHGINPLKIDIAMKFYN
jgi:HD-GYP domain-containing protein (c-di-GMP phosphodiesterase class II)